MKPRYNPPKEMCYSQEQIAESNKLIDALCEKLYPFALEAFLNSRHANKNRMDFEFLDRIRIEDPESEAVQDPEEEKGQWSKRKAADLARAVVTFWIDVSERERGVDANDISDTTWLQLVETAGIIGSRFWLDGYEFGHLLMKLVDLKKGE